MKIFGNLYPGKYRISVFDSKQCVLIKDDTLRQYHNPYVMAAHFDSVICYGEKNGQIIIDSVEGSYYTTYYQLFKCNEDGVYVPYRKDTINNSFVATIPTDSSSNDRTWKYYADTVKKRIPPLWEIDSLYKGYYKIALTDVNGCTTSVAERDLPFGEKSGKHYPIEVKEPERLQMSIIHQDTIIHEYGKKGGTVEVLVAGGNKGRFNIYIDSIVSDSMVGHAAWDIHETFKDIFMPDTTHKLYVQDHKECTDSVITGFMRQPDSPLMVEGIPHPAWCNGAEGSIKIIAKGGWGKYRYSCNLTGDTVAMRQPFDSVAASLTSDSIQVGGGLYVLTLIDSAGVMVYDTVLVTTPPALKADNLSRAAYCGSDGVIAVDISGGTAPYKIENDFGQETFRTAGGITAFSKSVSAGSYTVYIKDTNDCRFNVPVSIADSSVVVSIKRQYPTMRQYANGRLEAVAQRGHAPYTFLWTNRNTGETCANAVWNNVMAGTYSLVVSDGSGCEKDGEIAYLATNGDLPLTIDAVEGETAPNAKNGWARFTSDTSGFSKMMLHSALGGDIDVIGNISNQLNFELTGLAPDSYVLECMLPEGEVRYAEFTIAKYEPIVLLVNNINHASQPDASDGSATLQITGGVAPYVVQMLHNDVFYDDTVLNGRQLVLPQLSAGTYAAIVIDKYGKRENTRFIIKEPDSPMQLTAESVQSPSCYGYSNGQIWLKAQGGWGDYEYALAGSDYSRTTMYGNRSAESYTFIAIDAKGVTDTLTVELSQPEPLRAGVAKVDSVSCFGLFDGGVTFDITGGTAPYYVEFDSLFTKPGNYIGSLNGGLHTFRFTDANLCESEDDGLEVDVPQPEKLVIANDSVTPTTCNTDNGKIDIVIAGGIAPYTVKWKEDGLTVARLQGRTSIDSLQQLSLYSVVAVDANNCETEDRSYRMNRSSGPRINKVLTLPVLCYGDATGTAVIDSADITTAVPFAPFRIEWPNGQNAMSVNDLTAGAHLVTIIDTNNCVNSTRFEVGSPNPVEIKMIGSKDATCYGYTDGLISTLTLGGVGSYHYLWNTGDTLKDITSIGMGSYTIIATDGNNCHDSATFSIGQPDSLHVEIGEENVLMCPDNTYEFTATEGFKMYSWSLNDSVLSTKRNLIASEGGEYYLEATYGANCISRDTVTITIGDDLLEADFYMASDAAVDTSLALVELSNMQIDSLHWEFNYSDFVVVDSSDYELYLKPVNLGQHEITLWAYSGGCVSYKTKQVEISQLADTTHNINLGYNPLIKSITVMPNPTKGQFSISVKLRDEHNVEVSISSAGQGKPVERRDLSGKSEYYESFDLSNAGDGVYILRVVAGNEQRVAKVLLTK
ncbi:MAG: T9SS type A sorting domain-containing protein [Salinivirgaceae bacterium]|nr:T9SS type A sorting domain-containing protein [Salinivirgaceae bacterium]